MRIDAHHHLWRFDPVEYSWIGEQDSVLRRDYRTADLLRELESGGIDAAIAVQARQSLEENDALLADATASGGRIRGVVGWVDLAAPDVDATLARYAAQPAFVGVRHVVQAEPDPEFLARPSFNAGLGRLRAHGLVYDLLVYARQLPAAVALVDRHPSQPFVLDHIGKPTMTSARFDSTWARDLRELARRPHVVCKLSGLVTEVADATWTPQTLAPYLDVAIEAFGPARLLFGSDWPVCRLRVEYRDWVRTLEAVTSAWSAPERDAFWGGNAARVYG